jgi:uncharacterized protein (DUF305 family)
MWLPSKSIAAWAVLGCAAAAIATFAVTIKAPAQPGQCIQSGQHSPGGHPNPEGAADSAGQTFYSEMNAVNARMHADMKVSPGDDIDRDFMRMMIPHHQGAIDMARLLLKYGRDEKLKHLAQSIIVEEKQEIAYMRVLLNAWRAQTPDPEHGSDK